MIKRAPKVMKMRRKLFCICSLIVAIVVPNVNGQTNESVPVQEIVEEVPVLVADKDKKKSEVVLEKIQTLEEFLIEEEEDLLFPADELYGSNWDTRWVDPYKADTAGIVFPDSCEIDCSAFFMPLLKDTFKVTSKYGPRRRRMHRGIDLKLQVGDTVYAAFAGKVRIRNTERRGYGNYLVLRHPNGLETIYGHLSQWLVDVNDVVRAGDPIALGGNTGRSTGSHLHFETRFLGQAINPADIIDFETGIPLKDLFVFRNIKINGHNSNIYTASEEQVIYHRVKSGENLGAIARRYNTTVNELCKLNGLKPKSMLRVGQSIRCGVGQVKTTAEPENESTTIAQSTPATPAIETNDDAEVKVAANTNATPIYHRIQSGDTLGGIARRYGTTVTRLCELNQISTTTVLRLGRAIRCS
jgi:murein DD-endopeptidase MepM/ murein hydrolase activator NlpD